MSKPENTYYIVSRARIETAVPIMNIARQFKENGAEVKILCSLSKDSTKQDFARSNIEIVDIDPGFKDSRSYLNRVRNWLVFRGKFKKYFKEKNKGKSILYIASADTVLAIGKTLLQYNYILHLRELYDQYPMYLKNLGNYVRQAQKVIVAEYNRGAIVRSWFNLKQSPIVLPNRPVMNDRRKKLFIEDENARRIIEGLKDKKIILYQGIIAHERDLRALAAAMKDLPEEYVLVLLGKDYGHLKDVLAVNKDVVHIPYVLPPGHLQVTSHAYIGVVTYTYTSLNTVFCAPNKIWEYGAYGIPMIGNDIPGLRYTVHEKHFGICSDFDEKEAIIDAVNQVEQQYEMFSQNASKYYNENDTEKIIKHILN